MLPRSVVAFGAFATGLAIGRETPELPAALWFSLAAAACAVAGLTRRSLCAGLLGAAALCFGAGWFAVRLYEPPPGSVRVILRDAPAAARTIVTVEGRVLTSPHEALRDRDPLMPPIPDDGALRFDLAVRSLRAAAGPIPVSGTLHVHLSRAATLTRPLRAGAGLELTGDYEPVAGPMNPGETDRRLLAWQDGVAGSLRVSGTALVHVSDEQAGVLDSIESKLLRARAALSDRAREVLLGGAEPGEGRALLGALILGEQEPALSEVRSAFTRLGLAHLLAISGFHIVVMVGVVLFALRAPGDLGRVEPVAVALLVLLYLCILPFQAPVWRASLMLLGLLVAEALGRRHDRLASLGWIATLILLWRPMDLWSIGFQLSFGLVGVMMWLGERAHTRLFRPRLKGVIRPASWFRPLVLRPTQHLISTNLLCGLAALPLIVCRTGLISPLSVLAGVIMVPVVVLLLALAYVALAAGLLVPPVAGGVSWFLGQIAGWTAWLVERLDAIPGTSLRLPPVSVAWSVAATVVILYWLARGTRRDRPAWIASLVLALWLGAELWLGPALPRGVALRVDTLAVGDGTCQIVRSGRQALLWDCGSLTPGAGRNIVPRAARALGVWHTPVAVITHPNIDHFDGMLDVVEPLGVRMILVGEAFAEAAAARARGPEAYLLSELARRGVQVRTIAAGEKLVVGSAEVEFLSPPAGAAWKADNDRSLVARVRATPVDSKRPRSLLLTGDIQDEAIASLERRYPHLRADLMEVPHHGSAREAAFQFVEAINPAVVLQSTGPKRANDHRWDDVRKGRLWWCTSLDGALWAEIERDGSIRSGSFLGR